MGQLHKLPLLFLYFFIYSFFRNSCLLCYCHLFDYSFSGDRFDILLQILDGFDTIIIHRQQDLIKYEIKVSQRMVTDDYAAVTSTAEIYEQVFHDMKLAKINGNTKKVRYVWNEDTTSLIFSLVQFDQYYFAIRNYEVDQVGFYTLRFEVVDGETGISLSSRNIDFKVKSI